ncbi:MAG: helix-turn-helix domain-containing protein [Luteimonas sp.]|nr:helix-turn-helix domain-containing protein [Luteimonas sp.]
MDKSRKISRLHEVRQGHDASHLSSHLDGWEVRHPELRTIGQRLAHARAVAGINQFDMATKVGVALRTWQNYELDKRPPDAEVLTSLFRLGWSPTWVLTGYEPSEAGAGVGTSQDLSGEALMVSHELTEEALRGLWLPKHRFFDLLALIYAGVTQGLPYAEIIDFARSEASKLAKERANDDGEQGVGGTSEGGA